MFAYSVRDDRERKHRRDCGRTAAGSYEIDEVVFVATRAMSVQKREGLRAEIRETYG